MFWLTLGLLGVAAGSTVLAFIVEAQHRELTTLRADVEELTNHED